jgi:UDP-2,3-diacylglucosamine pyrophosphatase LpxH
VRAFVLSDLHLGPVGGAAIDEAFVSFVEWVVEGARSDTRPWRLILLGDLFDLLHVPVDVRDPLAALEAVAAEHSSALAALGAAAVGGIAVDLIPGNHDSELVDRGLQDRLRTLVAEAAGIGTARLRQNFRVRPWFLLVPGLLYAEHGSQYHALNAVADPLAPLGRWSRRMPPGAVLDLRVHQNQCEGRIRALSCLLPPVLGALAHHGTRNVATMTSLDACAQEAGVSPQALANLRGLAENSSFALLRNTFAAALGRARYVESRQQHAAVAIHRILEQERQAVPVYVFGHTHRLAHSVLEANGEQLLWYNGGAWTAGSYGFVDVDARADAVVPRLCRWDPAERAVLATSDTLAASAVAQGEAGAPTARVCRSGDRSADPVATP